MFRANAALPSRQKLSCFRKVVPPLLDIKVVARRKPHQALHSLRNLVLVPLPPKFPERNPVDPSPGSGQRFMRGNWLP